MSKKIAIITLHYPYNYGSVFQAYALQTYLEKYDIEVEIIDYIQEYDYEKYKLFRIKQYSKRPQSMIADILGLYRNISRKNNFLKFRKRFLHLSLKKYHTVKEMDCLNDYYDAFVCGSDQIWNLDCTNGIDKAYFLGFVKEKTKIAYAPSLAQYEFNNDDYKEMSYYLNRFDFLSVREKTSKKYLKKVTNKDIDVVVDPTLLLNKEDYDVFLLDKNHNRNQNYIFVYLLENNLKLLDYAKKISNEKKLKIIYISNISKKDDLIMSKYKNVFGTSPENFLKYIYNAKYIITNSFHATVFSIIFHKKFCTFRTKYSSLRMIDLLNSLELSDRLYSDNFLIDKNINYKKVDNNLERIKAHSYKYIKKFITKLEGN